MRLLKPKLFMCLACALLMSLVSCQTKPLPQYLPSCSFSDLGLCPRPMNWPIVSANPTESEINELATIIKQNTILWVECAAKVSVFIKEAQECID